MCPSSSPPATLWHDSRCLSSQAGPQGRKSCTEEDGRAKQKTNSHLETALDAWLSHLFLHAWEIKHYFIWGPSIELYFCLSLVEKPNLNGHLCISIVYVSCMHLGYQNGTVSNVTHHLQRGCGFSSDFHHTPQIPLTSYRMNSIHGITAERSSLRHGKKYRFFFFFKPRTKPSVYFTENPIYSRWLLSPTLVGNFMKWRLFS